MTFKNIIQRMPIKESVEKFTKKCFIGIVLSVCSLLLWKPVQALAADRTVANLVLMVDFENDTTKFATKYMGYEQIYTDTPYSGVHAYIRAISDGKVEINSLFPQDLGNGQFVSLTLPGSSKDYTKEREAEFVNTVVNLVNEKVKNGEIAAITTGLDSGNNDEYIDNVTFLVHMDDRVTPDKTSAFYPHKADIGSSGGQLFGKNMVVYNIVPSSSLGVDPTGRYSGLGYSTVSHELLHSLGAPDLYRTTGDLGEPVGIWDHMAKTAAAASYPLVYTRKDLGWIPDADIPTVTKSGDYELVPATNTSGTRAYILKTPLSSSEFFVVEYREKKGRGADYSTPYDFYLPESGLVVYRVNTAVEHTNAAGDNYMYVFRPGTQDSRGARETYTVTGADGTATEVNAVQKAAVGTASRPTLGNADMSAPCTADTIFYDDGTNSGIVINNVSFSNGKATFHVEFPELSGDTYWLPQGEAVNGLQGPVITGSKDGTKLYLAGSQVDAYGNRQGAALYGWQDETWKPLGTVGTGYTPIYDILYADDAVYMAYIENGSLTIGKYENGVFHTVYCWNGYYPTNAALIQVNNEVWVSSHASGTFNIARINGSSQLTPLQVQTKNFTGTADIGNPTAFFFRGKWYAVYSDFNASGEDAKGKIACYDTADNSWKVVTVINNLTKVRMAVSNVVGDTVYIVAQDADNTNAFLIWDGTTLQEQTLDRSLTTFSFIVKDQIPYIIRTAGTELRADYYKDGTWSELANKIASDANLFDAFCADGTMYVASSSTAGITTVRKMKTIDGTPDPDPVQPGVGSGNVVLTLPSGYNSSAKLYIDGVKVNSTAWQNDESKRLVYVGSNGSGPLGTAAQTAVAYYYDASGIPRGMYVWMLSYEGDHYTATAIPEFENLFTYHGFSVRYTGNTGLRCVYGIDSSKKAQLISTSGLNGYRITEMGTLIMRPDNYEENPMIYGSNKVSGGRTYWVANGKVNNKVIRKIDGRDRFANVLIKLPPSRYDTAYYFRPYAVMDYNGSNVVIYGPEMSRSMYTVCKQILGHKDFEPGTSGYHFLKNIVDSVENKQ